MKMALVATLIATAAPATTEVVAARDNPLLEPSTLPYQMPPFDRIRVADYVSLRAGIAAGWLYSSTAASAAAEER